MLALRLSLLAAALVVSASIFVRISQGPTDCAAAADPPSITRPTSSASHHIVSSVRSQSDRELAVERAGLDVGACEKCKFASTDEVPEPRPQATCPQLKVVVSSVSLRRGADAGCVGLMPRIGDLWTCARVRVSFAAPDCRTSAARLALFCSWQI